nr:arginase family protein [uncultured Carboxylicivirga sp.]
MIEEIKHYFERSSSKVQFSFVGGESEFLISQVTCLHDLDHVQFNDYSIAFIGVPDGRYSRSKGVANYPEVCRSFLWGLRTLDKKDKRILDLGNILGKTLDDRYKALEDVLLFLLKENVFPVVVGGGQDYTIPMAWAIKNINTTFRLSVVDAKIDWAMPEMDFSSSSYLGLLAFDKKRRPYDLSVIGVQKYLFSQYQQDQMKKASFDFLRLGEIRKKGIQISEPWLRDADIVSFDFTCVKQADQPAHLIPMPNGFSGDELCQLSWYAGVSDKLKAIGFFELDFEIDKNSQGSMLGAQAIWYALEGVCNRHSDFPVKNIDDYSQYIVHLNDYEIDMRFYNNPINDRWWVEVPAGEGKQIVACSKKDFEDASKNEIPERWFRFVNKKVL